MAERQPALFLRNYFESGQATIGYVLRVAGGLPEVIVATTCGTITYYVQVRGQILAQYGSGAWAYALPDHLGSVRQLSNAGGQVTLAQGYDPFGGLFESVGSGASEFGYTGEWWNADAELLFLRARNYDPGVGRLLSKDLWPGSELWPQSLNSWNYVAGNPINATDPSGYFVVPLRRICIFGVNPETGNCKGPFGIPPVFATTVAVDPASGTAQVALTVLTYLALGLLDDLEVSPPPVQVGNPWEGLQEWIPLEQQPSPHILDQPVGDTTEWLPPRLPGPSLDDVPPAPHILDFPLLQPCEVSNVLTIELTKEMLSQSRVIAKGKRIRDVKRLVRTYGGTPRKWVKKSSPIITINDRPAEIHWYEHRGIGRVEKKVVYK